MKAIIVRIFAIIPSLVLLVALSARADDGSGCALLGSLPRGVLVSFVADELGSGKRVAACNPNLLLKPASILKVLPGIVALKQLGPEFRFKTQVYADRSAGVARVLAIKGGGDPSLTIESLWLLIRRLKLYGINQIDQIILDTSRYDDPKGRVGQRAYQTGGGALSFNYNSIGFNVCPAAVGKKAIVVVDPGEVPIELVGGIQTVAGVGGVFSIDEIYGSGRDAQRFELRGTIGAERSCELIYRSVADPLAYLKRVLVELLKVSGIKFTEKVSFGNAPKELPVLFEHSSKSLGQILQDLNQFSNNFIAEQILFYLGDLSRPTLTRTQGLSALGRYAQQLHFSNFQFMDGSGLDSDNKVPAALINAALIDAAADPYISPDFEQSLSVAGHSGTLKKRPLPGVVFRGKTGTLDGVSSVAGYLTTKSGRKLALTLIINGPITKEVAVMIEDRGILSLNS